MARAFGIDLGTTNSVVAAYTKGQAEIILIEGQRLTPSVVYYTHDGGIIVGIQAKKRILIDAANTLSSTKRHIGSIWQKAILGSQRTPIDAALEVLAYLKREAEKTTGERMEKVVITVPAYFDHDQRKNTKIAAEQAGLEVLRLLPEPTAAAVCYGFNKEKDQNILVLDLGGGTFDVSLLEVKENKFTEKIIDGDRMLGGDDFDHRIVEHIDGWIKSRYGRSLKGDAVAQQKMKEVAERVKIELSSAKSADIYMPQLVSGIDVEIERFTIDEYRELVRPLLTTIVEKTKKVLRDGKVSMPDINRIVLVGGSCKHPVVKDLITEHFKAPYVEDDMDTAVARGAAIFCHSLMSPTNIEVSTNTSHTLGTNMVDYENGPEFFVPAIPRNTRQPAKAALIGYSFKNQTKVIIGVYRGEDRDISKNQYLGDLILPIDSRHVKYENTVGCIFELDENGILQITAFQVPNESRIINDPLFKNIESNAKSNLVPLTSVLALIKKYSIKTQTIQISHV